jgi:DNA-binding transcriptional MerR regulator
MHTTYTTGDLAARLNVSRDTIRNYARDFSEFLTNEATGIEPNARRRYTERDALILATIADLRANGLTVEQVTDALRGGRLVETVPPAPTPAEKEARENAALIVRPEYERVLDRVQQLEGELDTLRAERDRAIERWQDDTTALNVKIQALERELGEARGELTALKAERLPVRLMLQIAAVFIVGLLVFLALAVLYFGSRGG